MSPTITKPKTYWSASLKGLAATNNLLAVARTRDAVAAFNS